MLHVKGGNMVMEMLAQVNADITDAAYDAFKEKKYAKGFALSAAEGVLDGVELLSLVTGLAFYGFCTYATIKSALKR